MEQSSAGDLITLAHGVDSKKAPLIGQTVKGSEKTASNGYESLDAVNEWEEGGRNTEERQGSLLECCFNTTNMLMGVGILSLPYALKESGWAGLGVLLAMALVTRHTAILLSHCQSRIRAVDPRWSGSFPDIGEAAFGAPGRTFVGVVLYVELFFTLCLFVILLGTNLHHLYPAVSIQDWMAMSSAALIPLALLRDLSLLSYISMCGVAATLGLLGMVLFAGLSGLSPFGPSIFVDPKPTAIIEPNFPLCFGLIGFCFSGHAVFPEIYKTIKEPEENIPKMLSTSYVIVTLGCGAMAAVGYAHYGTDVKEQVTLSLPPGLGSTVVTWLIVVNGISKFGLYVNSIAMGFEEIMGPSTESTTKRWWAGSTFRVLCVALAWQVASRVTFFAYVASFIGAVMSMTVSVIIPGMCYLWIFEEDNLSWATKTSTWCIVLFGVVAAIAGTYATILGVSGG